MAKHKPSLIVTYWDESRSEIKAEKPAPKRKPAVKRKKRKTPIKKVKVS
jgi:hypothetical protein